MENKEAMEKELEELLNELSCEQVGTEKYKKLLESIENLQKILNMETERQNDILRAKAEEARVDNESMRLDIEREQLEIEKVKVKQSKAQNAWDLVKEGFKGFVYVLSSAAVIGTTIVINNSGESLPPVAQKFLNGKKL